jgi:hypothetical protein
MLCPDCLLFNDDFVGDVSLAPNSVFEVARYIRYAPFYDDNDERHDIFENDDESQASRQNVPIGDGLLVAVRRPGRLPEIRISTKHAQRRFVNVIVSPADLFGVVLARVGFVLEVRSVEVGQGEVKVAFQTVIFAEVHRVD